MIVGGAICGCSRSRWEEAGFGASLVGSLVHFGFHLGWLADRIRELHDQIIIKVVFVGRLRLLRDARPDNLTFDALPTPRCVRTGH